MKKNDMVKTIEEIIQNNLDDLSPGDVGKLRNVSLIIVEKFEWYYGRKYLWESENEKK